MCGEQRWSLQPSPAAGSPVDRSHHSLSLVTPRSPHSRRSRCREARLTHHTSTRWRTSKSRARTWKAVVARIGFVLVLLQIALGALLRHQLIGLTWHLLAGGLAALAVLVPAVAVRQESSARIEERRAAKWAIASLLVQVSLGVAVLLMILIGTSNVQVWLATTIAHVAVGSLTLLAAAWLARVLATRLAADDDKPERASP